MSDALLAAYHCIDRDVGNPRLPSLLEHAYGMIYNHWVGSPMTGWGRRFSLGTAD